MTMEPLCFNALALVCLGVSLCSGQQLDDSKGVWSECTVTCGGGTQFMLTDKTKARPCNTVSCPGDAGCLSAYLNFEHVTGKIIFDDSNNNNQATMIGSARIIDEGKFGKALRLTKDGSVSFDVIRFHNRPSVAITIALWLKLSEIKGAQEIFYTCGKTENYNLGAYHIKVDEGVVKWSQKSKDGGEIFSLASGKAMEKSKWYHIAGTHRLSTGKAKLFINGNVTKETTSVNQKIPRKLNDQWACADMGNPQDKKPLEGLIDEFYIFKCALLPEEISELFSKNAVKKFEIPKRKLYQ